MHKRIRLASIRLINFKSYENYFLDFTNNKNSIQRMTGLYGRNGVGKSTLLDAIGLLFKRYSGFDRERLATSFQRYVRNIKVLDVSGVLSNSQMSEDTLEGGTFKETSSDRFLIEAKFVVEDGRIYDVVIGNDPNNFSWSGDLINKPLKWHPDDISSAIEKQCYVTTYDKDLNKFQLVKSRWPVFSELFTAVSGFPVSSSETVADEETDKKYKVLYDQYILGLKINKPGETISDRQCSDGEKKIIKNFTTLLNMEFIPSIILIDNVEMHVEIDRHMSLINSIEKCFPDSQIIFTTHSESIISNAPIDMLVSLTNKSISRSDVWRRKLSRVIKSMKLLYNDEKSKSVFNLIEKDINNHSYTNQVEMSNRIIEAATEGHKILVKEIPEWVQN